jgi:benzil reductase ((S)-benzoin forming)
MKYFYISGTSRGIGKAIAEELLKDKGNYVIGISRSKSIKHANYEHITLDLTDVNSVQNFQFIKIIDAEFIALVNNAATLGEVKHIGKRDNRSILSEYTINLISPSFLMNNFIKSYSDFSGEKIILNISSGAGRHAIESWSTYCASKAALDMFSEVVKTEQNLNKENPVKVFSVAPGIVDTQMQTEIRQIDKSDFTDVGRFISYKENNILSQPQQVAVQIKNILYNPDNYNEVVLDVMEM